jgi:hypothetical protein
LGYEKLAYAADLSPVFVWRLMDGQKNPSYLTVYRLSQALAEAKPVDGVKATEDRLILGKLLIAAVNDAVANSKSSRSVNAS